MTPVALSLEELIPSNIGKSHMYAILIRTALVISTLVVGLSIPFFGEFLMLEQLLSSECMLFYSVKSFNMDFCSLVHLSEQFFLTHCDFLSYLTGLVMALIGSLLTMLVVSVSVANYFCSRAVVTCTDSNFLLQTLILPCACYLSILRGKTTRFQVHPKFSFSFNSFMFGIVYDR